MREFKGGVNLPCRGKIRYESRQEAVFAKQRHRRYLKGNPKPYFCKECSAWHLSKIPPKTLKAVARTAARRALDRVKGASDAD
jgi:hypothetical protein